MRIVGQAIPLQINYTIRLNVMDKCLVDLNHWLENEQVEQLMTIRKILKIVNAPLCKTIFAVLNDNDELTCPQILQMSEATFDTGDTYACLQLLEQLKIIKRIEKSYINHYSLEKERVLKGIEFLTCVLGGSDDKQVNVGNDRLEIKYSAAKTNTSFDYLLISHLLDCVNSLLHPRQKDLLLQIIKHHEVNKNVVLSDAQSMTFVDTDMKGGIHTLSSLSRDLRQFANCKLITRIKQKNFQHNALNVEYAQKIVSFLDRAKELKFDKKIEKKGRPKPVRLDPNLFK